MEKILVLGGTGFLGANLCIGLYKEGYRITSYSRGLGNIEYMRDNYPGIKQITGNYEKEEFSFLISDYDIIFILISSTNPSNKDLLKEYNENVIPTIKLLEECKGTNKKIIYFSSGGTVYGLPRYLPIDECHRTDPISSYGIQKLSIEKVIEYYGRTYNLDYKILRISNPYGAFQSPDSNQGVIAVFLAKVLIGKSIQVWGDGTNIRDYIYVDDVVEACCKIITYGGNEKIFNISSGIGHSIQEIIDIIKYNVQYRIDVKYIPARIQDVSVNILSNKLAVEELKWKPQSDLLNGIKRMCEMWNLDKKMFEVKRK